MKKRTPEDQALWEKENEWMLRAALEAGAA